MTLMAMLQKASLYGYANDSRANPRFNIPTSCDAPTVRLAYTPKGPSGAHQSDVRLLTSLTIATMVAEKNLGLNRVVACFDDIVPIFNLPKRGAVLEQDSTMVRTFPCAPPHPPNPPHYALMRS